MLLQKHDADNPMMLQAYRIFVMPNYGTILIAEGGRNYPNKPVKTSASLLNEITSILDFVEATIF